MNRRAFIRGLLAGAAVGSLGFAMLPKKEYSFTLHRDGGRTIEWRPPLDGEWRIHRVSYIPRCLTNAQLVQATI